MEITLALASDDAIRALYSSEFRLRFRVTIGSELEMELETRNVGNEPFSYEEALHTYLAIGDIRQVSVAGLEVTTYVDKTDGFKRKKQESEPVRIAKETDQVHLSTAATCTLHDPVWNRRIVIEKSGSNSTVIWNPWMDKTKSMSDMDAESWTEMLCVETANAADNAVQLSPGASHMLVAKMRIE
jgi:glucose-6-phosphate 1-epimerase